MRATIMLRSNTKYLVADARGCKRQQPFNQPRVLNMENQHRKISGYRELSQTEIDLMNKIKAKGVDLEDLIQEIKMHVAEQIGDARVESKNHPEYPYGSSGEEERLQDADPTRWL